MDASLQASLDATGGFEPLCLRYQAANCSRAESKQKLAMDGCSEADLQGREEMELRLRAQEKI